MKIGEKLEKVGKSGDKWGKRGENWEKAGKSWKCEDIFSQNGRCRPFWMTENHFRSHFSPFQINTKLLFFFQNGRQQTFWTPIFSKIDRDLPL